MSKHPRDHDNITLYELRTTYGLHNFCGSEYTLSNARLKLAKNQVKAKQQPEAQLLLFENYSLSSSTLSFKNNRKYSRK